MISKKNYYKFRKDEYKANRLLRSQSASPLDSEEIKPPSSKQLLDLRSKLVMEFIEGKKTTR